MAIQSGLMVTAYLHTRMSSPGSRRDGFISTVHKKYSESESSRKLMTTSGIRKLVVTRADH